MYQIGVAIVKSLKPKGPLEKPLGSFGKNTENPCSLIHSRIVGASEHSAGSKKKQKLHHLVKADGVRADKAYTAGEQVGRTLNKKGPKAVKKNHLEPLQL